MMKQRKTTDLIMIIIYNNYTQLYLYYFYQMSLSFLLIRNAQSVFDQAVKQLKHKNPGCQNVTQLPQYQQMKISQKYIDSQLSTQSKFEIESLKKNMIFKDVEVVITSPLYACLETCNHLFRFNGPINYYVEPLLTQRLMSVAEISKGLKSFREKALPNFQFERFESQQNSEYWQVNFNIIPQRYLAALKGKQKEDKKQYFEELIKIIEKEGEIQNQQDLYERIKDLKTQLVEYSRRFPNKKMAIIAHEKIIEMLTATSAHQDGRLINAVRLEPCEKKHVPIIVDYVDMPKLNGYCGC